MLLIMGMGAQLTAWPVELCDELVDRGYRVVLQRVIVVDRGVRSGSC
jgi:hypothetical protein